MEYVMTMEEELKTKFRVKLESFHCPMNWKIPIDPLNPSFKVVSERAEIKLNETEDSGIFKWDKFTYLLILCYELYRTENYAEALEKNKECENVMNIADSKGYYEQFYIYSKDAILHCLTACKCYILFASGNFELLEDVIKEIPMYEDMNVQNKAALLGLQASFLMEYEHEGNKNGLRCIDEAIKMNPDEGQWHYLLGKCLQRIRQVEDFGGDPSKRELEALDTAHAITNSPLCFIYMAAALREASFYKLTTYGKFDNRSFEKTKSLLRMAMEEARGSSHILARCAFGFWRLPKPYRDPQLAEECFQRALEINPHSTMGNHIAGIINESRNNYNEAKEYYRKAGELGAYGAFLNLQKLRLREEEAYDPLPDLEYMLTKFRHEPTRLLQTKIHIGAAYLFLKDDLSTALDFWMEVIDKDPSCHILERYISNILKPKLPLNIYELIINETRLALHRNKTLSVEDKLKYQQAYEKCIAVQPKFQNLLLSPLESWKKRFYIARKQREVHHGYGNERRQNFSRNNSFNPGGANSNNWRKREGVNSRIDSTKNCNTNWRKQ